MTALLFLTGWAIRSAILILAGAIALRAARVKDPAVQLAVWTTILLGSLATPALTRELPTAPVILRHTAVAQGKPMASSDIDSAAVPLPVREGKRTMPFDWTRAGIAIYAAVSSALLLRLCLGLAMSLSLLGRSRATGHSREDLEIRESDEVTSPVALGILHPAILIPSDWRQWSGAKLNAVVAHEHAHLRRYDPAVQALSAIHRALLWFSPFSWMLHRSLVRAAEDASDDSAVSAIGDRAVYAEVLLDFMKRVAPESNWVAVPMASHGRPDVRIQRILEGTTLSHGVTRRRLAGILAIVSPVVCLVAAANPQNLAQAPAVTQPAPFHATAQAKTESTAAASPRAREAYLAALGSVTALNTVHVKSRIDGLLKSVDFKEGALVKEGDVLASVEPREVQVQQAAIQEAQTLIAGIKLEVKQAEQNGNPGTIEPLKGRLASEKAELAHIMAQYAVNPRLFIRSPLTGLAGLRTIDPGNTIHADDATIVTITQIQPIAVLFSIPEDSLPAVRERLRAGGGVVEAWNRSNTAKIATGRLMAIDNQIDANTGTAKLKAEFINEDGSLFPNQFVNVRLFLANHN